MLSKVGSSWSSSLSFSSARVQVQATCIPTCYLTLNGWVTDFIFRHLTLHIGLQLVRLLWLSKVKNKNYLKELWLACCLFTAGFSIYIHQTTQKQSKLIICRHHCCENISCLPLGAGDSARNWTHGLTCWASALPLTCIPSPSFNSGYEAYV